MVSPNEPEFQLSPPSAGDVRVLVVGGDPLARSGLSGLLSVVNGVAVVGEAAPDELSFAAESLQPQVLLWDLGLRASSTPSELTTELTSDLPAVALLPNVQDEQDEAAQATLALAAFAAGARGLLLRDADRG